MKKLAYLLACLTLLAFPLPAAALSESSSTVYDGIDVSHWQGEIDFEQVAASGISIVYIKASEGTTLTDANFEANYQRARENGLKVGFYHYVTANTVAEAIAEANYFASRLAGKDYDCLPAMDYESFPDSLSNTEIIAIAQSFVDTLNAATGNSVVIYSNVSNADNVFGNSFTNYPLWIADFSGVLPDSAGGWDRWAGYQYSGSGNISGIRTAVDLNRFTADVLLTDHVIDPGNTGDTTGINGDSSEPNREFSFMATIAGISVVMTIAVGGGGLSIGLRLARRTANEQTAVDSEEFTWPETTPGVTEQRNESRQQELAEIKRIEELELIELTQLQEDRRQRLQEQRRLRELAELEELRELQKKAQNLQEELWALKEKAKQDLPTQN